MSINEFDYSDVLMSINQKPSKIPKLLILDQKLTLHDEIDGALSGVDYTIEAGSLL